MTKDEFIIYIRELYPRFKAANIARPNKYTFFPKDISIEKDKVCNAYRSLSSEEQAEVREEFKILLNEVLPVHSSPSFIPKNV